MIRRIDRVINDLKGEVEQFKAKKGTPIVVGVVGTNRAERSLMKVRRICGLGALQKSSRSVDTLPGVNSIFCGAFKRTAKYAGLVT